MRILRVLAPLFVLAAALYAGYPYLAPYFTKPCAEPLAYHVAKFDARFGISEAAFNRALSDAAAVWNEAAGRELIVPGEGEIGIELVYGEVQKTSELGEKIDSEQGAYDTKRSEVEALKEEYADAKQRYDSLAASFEKREAAYKAKVDYWNARGGAPPQEFQELKEEGDELAEAQEEVNAQVPKVNALAKELNVVVDELNRLAQAINRKVNVFNQQADEEFDQGKYVRDGAGERITIYEFSDTTELRRVLVHEFGHALGLGHVDNPDSIMFAYDIGEGVEPTKEDIAELVRACALN